MASTRERIMQSLLTSPRSSINELAEAVGINGISVRHHLSSLQGEGLVAFEEERHGVGRPRLVYFLTEKALEKFPMRYLSLTNRLLDQMRETLPQQVIDKLFKQMATRLLAGYANKIHSLSTHEKLDLIKELLGQEGFSVDWVQQGNQILINEITCPYYHIGKSHPEVCQVDQTLISAVLSQPVEKINCVLNGDSHCTYVIPDNMVREKVA
jgi:DeoR family transcriptional regulator, suf operon transcriptional repressor